MHLTQFAEKYSVTIKCNVIFAHFRPEYETKSLTHNIIIYSTPDLFLYFFERGFYIPGKI